MRGKFSAYEFQIYMQKNHVGMQQTNFNIKHNPGIEFRFNVLFLLMEVKQEWRANRRKYLNCRRIRQRGCPAIRVGRLFLRSAAWQYKYPFEDQLLIYAQRPDATACAGLEVWNNKLHRWINRGAKGIALLRENERGHYLDYVFDVSDTNSFYGNAVRLWQFEAQYTRR